MFDFGQCGYCFILFVTEIMMNMGYSRKEIEDSLSQNKYDDITATYLLLGRRTMEVSECLILFTRTLTLKTSKIVDCVFDKIETVPDAFNAKMSRQDLVE